MKIGSWYIIDHVEQNSIEKYCTSKPRINLTYTIRILIINALVNHIIMNSHELFANYTEERMSLKH